MGACGIDGGGCDNNNNYITERVREINNTLNVTGSNFHITVSGADEALYKLNLLQAKIKEVQDLIRELNAAEVKVKMGDEDIQPMDCD